MRFTNPSALLAAVIALTTAPFASGLGINCNGSFLCGNTFCSGGLVGLRNSLQTAINNGRGGDFFGSGQQIACQGFCCAFFQNGASGRVYDVLNNVNALINHGCHICGSNPTLPGNNVATGELTVNYVNTACVGGYCYS